MHKLRISMLYINYILLFMRIKAFRLLSTNISTIIPFSQKCFLMMTSSNGNTFRVTGPLCGEFTGHRWIPLKRPVTRNFTVFFDMRLNKRFGKQSCDWWFETPSCPFWRHRNVLSVNGHFVPPSRNHRNIAGNYIGVHYFLKRTCRSCPFTWYQVFLSSSP